MRPCLIRHMCPTIDSRILGNRRGKLPGHKNSALKPIAALCLLMIALAARCEPTNEFHEPFLKFCNLANADLNSPKRHVPFYQDSYAVRALAVAYDITGNTNFLNTCRQWSDRMLKSQGGMSPAGAYYMNYDRRPGITNVPSSNTNAALGWYVADSSCIAMGILATAVRCPSPVEKARYLDSVKSFTDLVLKNYLGPHGGICNGEWPTSRDEWWCSSGTFGSLLFLLYDETGDPRYRDAALKVVEWLNNVDLETAAPFTLKQQGASMPMYLVEAYSAAWPHLAAGSPHLKGAQTQMKKCLDWMAHHQASRGNDVAAVDYHAQWGSKMGGLPFHMLVYARYIKAQKDLVPDADRELRYLLGVLDDDPPTLSQLAAFAVYSLAERSAPGAIYRCSPSK